MFELEVIKIGQAQSVKWKLLLCFFYFWRRRALLNKLILAHYFMVELRNFLWSHTFKAYYVRIEFGFLVHHLNWLVFQHIKLVVVFASTYSRENSILNTYCCQKLVIHLFLILLLILMGLFIFILLTLLTLFDFFL